MKKKFLCIMLTFVLLSCAKAEKKTEDSLFYPPLPQQPRLQYLTSITTEADIGKKSSAFMEFVSGEQPEMKALRRPYSVGAVKDKIYVSDRGLGKIIIIDLKNENFDYIKGVREGRYTSPAGIWVTDDDFKYIADFARRQILVYDAEDKFVKSYGKKDQFDKPLSVAVSGSRIFVSDFGKHQISVIDKISGEIVQTIGEYGKNEGEFFRPFSIAVDAENNLYVNDSFNFRVQQFDADGQFVKFIGFHGDTIGGFARPKGIALDAEDHFYVVDAAFENVQIFDAFTAQVLLSFGGFTEVSGGMYLPSGISIDYKNVKYFKKYADKDFRIKYLVYVCNTLGTRKLNVYGFGEWTGKPLQ